MGQARIRAPRPKAWRLRSPTVHYAGVVTRTFKASDRWTIPLACAWWTPPDGAESVIRASMEGAERPVAVDVRARDELHANTGGAYVTPRRAAGVLGAERRQNLPSSRTGARPVSILPAGHQLERTRFWSHRRRDRPITPRPPPRRCARPVGPHSGLTRMCRMAK